MASSLRNLARRNVPEAPPPEQAPPSVSETVPPVTEEVEAIVTPSETESVSDGHVAQQEPATEETPGDVVTEAVVEAETETEPEPTAEDAPEAPVVVSAPVEEVKVTTPPKKKKKAQGTVTTGEASTDEKKEVETK
jgi:hypothetical protein